MAEEDIFSRWSRRRRAVAEEERRETVAEEAAEVAVAAEAEPETPEEEAALLERLGLPVPESLRPGDDFSVFMAKAVPEFLRRRALRVLWRSNPVLANLDGLNDYDADFNAPELNQKVLATAYQVGRGFLRSEALPEILQDNDREQQIALTETANEALMPDNETQELEEAEVAPSDTPDESAQSEEKPFSPKRMRFQS